MSINQTSGQQKRKNQSWMRDKGMDVQSSGSGHSGLEILFKNLSLLTSGGMLMLGLLILVGLWRSGSQFLNNIGSIFSITEPPAKVDVRSTIIQQIRGASELTTAVYSMESVVPTSRERMLGNYVIGKTTLLYIAHGEVRAGVDLAALRTEDVQVIGEVISLRLPPPKILDSKIDVNRSKVYDYDRGFMGLGPDVAPELQELAQRETLTKIVETACTDGVLQAANDRAKLVVSQLLTTAGYAQFTVETQPPVPETCAMPSPSSSATPASPVPSLSPPPSPVPNSIPDSVSPPLPIPTPDATVVPPIGP